MLKKWIYFLMNVKKTNLLNKSYSMGYRSHISSPTQLLMGPVDVRPSLNLDGTPPQHLQQPPQQPEITSIMEADRYFHHSHPQKWLASFRRFGSSEISFAIIILCPKIPLLQIPVHHQAWRSASPHRASCLTGRVCTATSLCQQPLRALSMMVWTAKMSLVTSSRPTVIG